jgi:hypothetical protein
MSERSARSSGRPQGSRPGTRRLSRPGGVATAPAAGDAGAGTGGDGPEAADPGPPPRRRRPRFTRRRQWQALILVEVIVALGVAQALAHDPNDFSLDGVERERFCPAVQRFRLEGSYQSTLTIESAPTLYDQQARAYRELSATAPTDVRPDFDKLAGLSEQLAATARDLQEHQRRDPTFGAQLALTERQGEMVGGAVDATHRVELSIRQACGIDLSDPLPTTTAAPSSGLGVPNGQLSPAPPSTSPPAATDPSSSAPTG